ncbi:hypothetical protein HZA87_02435 [Candidatus Uhrbacteria bacterium]|nr:hypothetical protein [Candidatus Uhrbacteria bacterium]
MVRRLFTTLLALTWLGFFSLVSPAVAQTPTTNDLVPNLSIDIPGISFSAILSKGGVLSINFLQDYIAGVYKYLIGIGTLIAIVLIMIGGLQYALAAQTGDVKKAQERIRNAVTGLALLISVYLLLAAVNPNLIIFRPLRILNVEGLALEKGINNDEGLTRSSSSSSSSSTGSSTSASKSPCEKIIEEAQTDGTCDIEQTVISPTSEAPICDSNSHWTDETGTYKEYSEVTELDFGAGFGVAIMAPMDGTVSYVVGEDTKCGNWITLTGSGKAEGAQISFCHVADFVDDVGEYHDNTAVSQGDTIGHSGGVWCTGEEPPADWDPDGSATYVDGTACTDPTTAENCDCQTVLQAGLSKAAHIHMQWHRGGDLLACVDF